jgi:hypothetical protein
MSYPENYVVFDTETNEHMLQSGKWDRELTLRLGVAKHYRGDGGKYVLGSSCRFERAHEFHDWVESVANPRSKLWIFAHNIGFDLRVVDLWGEVGSGRYSIIPPPRKSGKTREDEIFVVMDDPPTMIKTFLSDGSEIFWCDTFQWISSSLRKLGETLGYPKGEMPDASASDDIWYAYCERDVDVLNQGLIKIWEWLRSKQINTFCPTRAGQSLQIFNQLYQGRLIQRHDNPTASHLERQAYYGGFTDLFRCGKIQGPIYQLDVNSLYPYVMRDRWYPIRLVAHHSRADSSLPSRLTRPKACTAHVRLYSPIDTYPLKCREGTLHVRGRIETVLAGPELERAVERRHITEILSVNEYETAPIFREFVRDFWADRKRYISEKNDVYQMIVKLLMNSLYGKFGQQTPEWIYSDEYYDRSVFMQGYAEGEDGEEPVRYRVLAGKRYVEGPKHEARGSFVAIASFTTSYAREYMRHLRETAGSENIYYQATDSLYTSETGYRSLQDGGYVNPSKLGALKVEAVYNTCTFSNIHHIDKDGKKIRGSIRSGAVDLGGESYRVDMWESFPVSTFGDVTDRVRIRSLVKTLSGRYTRGRVDTQGVCIPYTIDNIGVPPDVMRKQSIHKYLVP